MRYFGGKQRICKEIAHIINEHRLPHSTFLSPFVGGGWVETLIHDPKICSDNHTYLIQMYQALQQGWMPPQNISQEQYEHIKLHPNEQPPLTGFVGFGCSFAGKWFGGYAKDKTNRNFCRNAYKSILKKMNGFHHTQFLYQDYKNHTPINYTIYSDPPYQNKTQYRTGNFNKGSFDTEEFWNIMRIWSTTNLVFISEYNAPPDFIPIWTKSKKLDILDKNNAKKETLEKLFIHESKLVLYNSP